MAWRALAHNRSHRRRVLLALALLVVLFWSCWSTTTRDIATAAETRMVSIADTIDVMENHVDGDGDGNDVEGSTFKTFFKSYFSILGDSVLQGPPFAIGMNAVGHHQNIFRNYSKRVLSELESFDKSSIEKLKQTHSKIVSSIPLNINSTYYTGNGYVTIGGGENDFLAVLMIRQLRDTGARLPVQVIIPPFFEADANICNNVLPNLGATCIKLDDVFGSSSLRKLRFNNHLIQTLAVTGSSFAQVCFLSPSTVPLHNPDFLFRSQIFNDFGLILWPSYYRKTISPSYYEIAGIDVENERVRTLNDRWTPLHLYERFKERFPDQPRPADANLHDLKGTVSELSTTSDIYLIDKTRNLDVLLLSLYYTNDGPGRYFPLLNLASYKTNGDYLSASAHYLQKPYYELFKAGEKIGEATAKSEFFLSHSSITAHYNPMEDYELLMGQVHKVWKDIQLDDGNAVFDYYQNFRKPFSAFTSTPLFFHAEGPGLNPLKIKERGLYFSKDEPQKRIFGQHIRFYGADFELNISVLMNSLLCDEDTKIEFPQFTHTETKSICSEFLRERVRYLDKSSNAFWHRYQYEKRPPLPIPEQLRPQIQELIKSGLLKDFDYTKTSIQRPAETSI